MTKKEIIKQIEIRVENICKTIRSACGNMPDSRSMVEAGCVTKSLDKNEHRYRILESLQKHAHPQTT